MRWMLKKYMAIVNIDSFKELAEATGIKRKTLYDRMKAPRTIKVFEIEALDEVLHFTDEDLVLLAKGEIKGEK